MKTPRRGMALILLCAALAGCAAQQQREVNAAFASAQTARQNAAVACASSPEVASCMLGLAAVFGGGAANSPPVVRSDLDVVLNSSVLGAGIGAVRDVQVARSSERAQIAAVQATAATQQAQTAAFATVASAGVNAVSNTAAAGFTAVEATAGAGFTALGNVAGTGFQSMEALGSNAAAAAGSSSAAWAATVANLPPTFQLGSGAVFGDGNTTQNGAGSIDQSTVGRDRDVTRNCTASTTSAVTNSQAGSTSGTTGAVGGQLGFAPYPQLPASNECGG